MSAGEQSDPIEIMAREIRPAAFNDAHAFAAREWATVLAKGSVRALDEAGFAIVPKGLTSAQWQAAKKHADSSSSSTAFYEVAVEAGRVKP